MSETTSQRSWPVSSVSSLDADVRPLVAWRNGAVDIYLSADWSVLSLSPSNARTLGKILDRYADKAEGKVGC